MYIPFYNRFIAGSTLKHAIIRANNLFLSHNYKPIYDFSYEDPNNESICYKELKYMSTKLENNLIAIKLSGLNFNEKYIREIIHLGMKKNNKLLIDAENIEIQDKINNITNDLLLEFNSKSIVNIYKTYQMYKKDSYNTLMEDLIDFNHENILLGIKLVRGAYYKTDYKSGKLFDNIEQTHNSYNSAANLILKFQKNVNNKVIFDTHNKNSIDKENIMFAQLLGMADNTSNSIIKKNFSAYKYFPYGSIYHTLPYFSRRLYENYEIMKYLK